MCVQVQRTMGTAQNRMVMGYQSLDQRIYGLITAHFHTARMV